MVLTYFSAPFFIFLVLFAENGHGSSSGNSTKMVVTFGKPVDYFDYDLIENWDDCLKTCYFTADCVLIYQVPAGCWMFHFGNVTSVQQLGRAENEIVAFKRSVPSDTCPTGQDPPLFGATASTDSRLVDQTAYSTTITQTGSVWRLTYTTSRCPADSMVSQRDNVTVCIQCRRFASNMGNWFSAWELCESDGGITLTGPFNTAELDYITSYLAGGTRLWLDGRSAVTPKVWEYEDVTHNGTFAYPWYPGEPSATVSNNCLYIGYCGNHTDDTACLDIRNGAVCLVEMVNI